MTTEKQVEILNKIADLMHPHMKGDNYTRTLIKKAVERKPMTKKEIFDSGINCAKFLLYCDEFSADEQLNLGCAVSEFKQLFN